jgi:hypothetical protein
MNKLTTANVAVSRRKFPIGVERHRWGRRWSGLSDSNIKAVEAYVASLE